MLFYLDRIDIMTGPARLPRPASAYFKTNISVTPSGIFSQRYSRRAIEVLGPDRVFFSADHPFEIVRQGGARRFLEMADLSDAERGKIASGNWARLCAGIRR